MKKYLIIALLALNLVVLPQVSKASTLDDLSSLVKQLSVMVGQLRSQTLGAVITSSTTPTAICVDYDYGNRPATNTPPLPLVKGWTYDTISNPTFNPSVIPNPQNETYGDYCTMNGIRATSSSGVGSGLMERYCTNNRRSSRYYLYNGATGYSRLQEVCPNGCSNGACIPTVTVADLSAILAPSSPLAGQVQINAAGGDTMNIPLAVYRLRSSLQTSTLYSLAFNIVTNPSLGKNLLSSLKLFRLTSGVNSYYGTLSGNVVTFTIYPSLVLTQDTNKDLTLSVNVAATSSDLSASASFDVSKISAVDVNYNTPTYGGLTISTVPSGLDVVGNILTFTSSALIVTSAGPITISPIDNGPNPIVAYNASFSITLVNPGVAYLYVSGINGNMFTTSLNPSPNASTTIYQVWPVASIDGDNGTSAYIIPAGSSRTFNVRALIGKKMSSSTYQTLTVVAVNYGTAAGTYNKMVTAGLGNLYKTVSFSGNF